MAMPVLHVVGGTYNWGGTYTAVLSLARCAVARRRHALWMHRDIVRDGAKGEIVREGVIRLPHGGLLHDAIAGLRETPALLRHIRAHGPMILHAHTRVGIVAACLAGRITGAPLLVHMHYLASHPSLYRRLWRMGRARIVFNSARTCVHFGCDPVRNAVIHPSIVWPSPAPAEFGARSRLVCAGAYVRLKGFDRVAEAAGVLDASGQPVQTVLFGCRQPALDPACDRRLHRLAAAIPSVMLAPWADDWSANLRAADIFVHPAAVESFGVAVLEAFARGIRLILGAGTLVDDLPEPQRSCSVFRLSDPSVNAVVQRVHEALRERVDSEKLWRLRRTVADRFDATRNATRLEDLYVAMENAAGTEHAGS